MPHTMSAMHSPSRATESTRISRVGRALAKLLAASAVSAVVVGSVAVAFQYVKVVPLILDAEAFESRRLQESTATNGSDTGEAGDEPWAPSDGLERGMFSWLSDMLTTWAFALILLGCYFIDHRYISHMGGLQRGAMGWVAFMASPSLGLSPELPGMQAADLTDRQWWWLSSVAAALAGLLLAILGFRHPDPPPPSSAKNAAELRALRISRVHHWLIQLVAVACGVAVGAIPHWTGAPHPHLRRLEDVPEVIITAEGPPAELAAQFGVWCLATAFAYWLVLGVVTSLCFNAAMDFEAVMPIEVSHKLDVANPVLHQESHA
ncbi:hypothetical protein AB1Y20_000257 [Prymnesium parvum]|uniref:Uncharacterized protein n=1 Tax=Prymnesium parvum TaxID=97485 RepID=A0AB34K7Z5_PRYPA